MFEPDDLIRGISAYINLKITKSRNSQHFFYVANDNIGIAEIDLKNSISYFIKENIKDINCININDIIADFKNLSGEEKANWLLCSDLMEAINSPLNYSCDKKNNSINIW